MPAVSSAVFNMQTSALLHGALNTTSSLLKILTHSSGFSGAGAGDGRGVMVALMVSSISPARESGDKHLGALRWVFVAHRPLLRTPAGACIPNSMIHEQGELSTDPASHAAQPIRVRRCSPSSVRPGPLNAPAHPATSETAPAPLERAIVPPITQQTPLLQSLGGEISART
ncbi:unnamed protein product [Lota lota]